MRHTRSISIALCLIGLGLAACETVPRNTGEALEFSSAERPTGDGEYPNWPASPSELEEVLPKEMASGEFEVRGAAATEYGLGGAENLTLYLPAIDKEIQVKWKAMPERTLDEYNNRARKTIAAYELQKLFLDPEDYVVPFPFAFCMVSESQRPSLSGSNCTFGAISVWLQDVTFADPLYEEDRFVSDPAYAYYLANFNLFTYLAQHRDAKMSNALASEDDTRRQVYSIDNDLAFDDFVYNYFIDHWDQIFVPALREDSIERLRKLEREDLESLGAVAQFEADGKGGFTAVPAGDNLDPNRPVRITGDTVQFGLTRHEIDRLWARMQTLLQRVDEGEIPVFGG